MCKLRIRFKAFYAEYGCLLRACFTIQALSLIISTTIEDLFVNNDAVIDYKRKMKKSNYDLYLFLSNIYEIVVFTVPMFTSLSCLIFAWIRHRRRANEPKSP